jgi:hypothetical protein
LGNIFLSYFDSISNTEDVTCIRFVDDYVLLGPDEKSVKARFLKGKKFLNEKGLEVYDPFEKGGKGEYGNIQIGFSFLGCDIKPGRISPSIKGVGKLKDKIQLRIHKSLNHDDGVPMADTLLAIRNTVQGWGNSYSFCNNKLLMAEIDKWIIKTTLNYHQEYSKKIFKIEDPAKKVSLLGVKSLLDCKQEPIYKAMKSLNAK